MLSWSWSPTPTTRWCVRGDGELERALVRRGDQLDGDARSCPRCTLPLEHSDNDWHCSCGFAKPSTLAATLDGVLHVGSEQAELDLSIPGDFNRGNAALAATALAELVWASVAQSPGLNTLSGVAGRFTLRSVGPAHTASPAGEESAGFDALLSTVDQGDSDVWGRDQRADRRRS